MQGASESADVLGFQFFGTVAGLAGNIRDAAGRELAGKRQERAGEHSRGAGKIQAAVRRTDKPRAVYDIIL